MNPSWARIRKRKPFFHLAKTRHLAFRDCKKIGWQQLLVDCANSIVTHKDFQEQHSSLLPPGGSYFEENYLQKLKSIGDQNKSFDTDGIDFLLRPANELLRSCSKLQCQHCKLSSGVGNRVFRDSLPLKRGIVKETWHLLAFHSTIVGIWSISFHIFIFSFNYESKTHWI